MGSQSCAGERDWNAIGRRIFRYHGEGAGRVPVVVGLKDTVSHMWRLPPGCCRRSCLQVIAGDCEWRQRDCAGSIVCQRDRLRSRCGSHVDVAEAERRGRDACGPEPVPVSGGQRVGVGDDGSLPVRAPRAVGVKTTLMEQVAPEATEPQALEVTEKSPVAVALVTVTGKIELFVQVKVLAAEVSRQGQSRSPSRWESSSARCRCC